MRQRALLALLLLAGLLTQCRHGTPVPAPTPDPLSLLPPETQTGAGTFGCLINGQAYTAPFSTLTSGDYTLYPQISINGQIYKNDNYSNEWYAISLVLNGNFYSGQPTVFDLAHALVTGKNQFYTTAASSASPCYYTSKYPKRGQLTLTKFDGVARTASGRFAFTLYEPSGCDTLRVTDGRFDVKF